MGGTNPGKRKNAAIQTTATAGSDQTMMRSPVVRVMATEASRSTRAPSGPGPPPTVPAVGGPKTESPIKGNFGREPFDIHALLSSYPCQSGTDEEVTRMQYVVLIYQGSTPLPGSDEWGALADEEQKQSDAAYGQPNQNT